MEPELFSVPDVTLLGPYALGFKNGVPVPPTYLWREDVLEQTPYPTEFTEAWRVFKGATVSLVNIWSPNYFHWLLENLVQLMYIERERITRIILPPTPAMYVWQSLRLLGMESLAFQWDGVPTQVEELIGFGPVRMNGRNFVEGIDRMTVAFYLELLQHDDQEVVTEKLDTSHIYISRHNATKRRVLNEDVLYRLLREKGWGVIVHPESMTLQEQVRAFSQAEVIVSPHGAGLTNMVWAKGKPRIVELFGSYHNPCYEKLADDLGYDYTSIDGDPVESDMFAPLEVLEEIL